jgi:RNA polymerase-binding transcription factor DksA
MAITTDEIIERLRSELEEAQQELEEFTDEATHPPEAELGGGSSGYSTWQTAVVLRQHVENRIEELEAAIDRAEKGLYGVCEECGEPIPPERLEALPFTTLCVDCASKAH